MAHLKVLQMVQNATAHLLAGLNKCHHETPLLKEVTWLHINLYAQLKLMVLTLLPNYRGLYRFLLHISAWPFNWGRLSLNPTINSSSFGRDQGEDLLCDSPPDMECPHDRGQNIPIFANLQKHFKNWTL